MDTVCALIKLKKETKKQVQAWAKYMMENKEEALESLKNESVLIESVFYHEIDNTPYLIYYMKADDMQQAKQVAKQSTLAVDAYHKQFKKDCWEQVTETELLLDLNSDSK